MEGSAAAAAGAAPAPGCALPPLAACCCCCSCAAGAGPAAAPAPPAARAEASLGALGSGGEAPAAPAGLPKLLPAPARGLVGGGGMPDCCRRIVSTRPNTSHSSSTATGFGGGRGLGCAACGAAAADAGAACRGSPRAVAAAGLPLRACLPSALPGAERASGTFAAAAVGEGAPGSAPCCRPLSCCACCCCAAAAAGCLAAAPVSAVPAGGSAAGFSSIFKRGRCAASSACRLVEPSSAESSSAHAGQQEGLQALINHCARVRGSAAGMCTPARGPDSCALCCRASPKNQCLIGMDATTAAFPVQHSAA